MIPPKRFDILSLTGGCSEVLDAFRFVFNHNVVSEVLIFNSYVTLRLQNVADLENAAELACEHASESSTKIAKNIKRV